MAKLSADEFRRSPALALRQYLLARVSFFEYKKIRAAYGLRGLVMIHEQFRQGYSNMGSSKSIFV